jgi:hypothetical protein
MGLLGSKDTIISRQDNAATPTPTNKPKTLAEFFREKKPATDLDKTLLVAYFLEKFEHQEAVNVDDLAQAYLSAKEKIPSNINDAVNKNVRKGTMMEIREKKNGKKAWLVSRTGEELVELGFGK